MKLRTRSDEFVIMVGDASVTVCPLSATVMSCLRNKHARIKKGKEIIDGAAVSREMFCKVVRGWKNIQDDDGTELSCTDENKLLVHNHNPEFVGDVFEEMDAELEARRQGEQGNSSFGASGDSTRSE